MACPQGSRYPLYLFTVVSGGLNNRKKDAAPIAHAKSVFITTPNSKSYIRFRYCTTDIFCLFYTPSDVLSDTSFPTH